MRSIIIVLFCVLTLTTACNAQKQLKVEDVLGEWTGESKCENNDGYCHDEIARYAFSAVRADASKVHGVTEKLINGKWEPMTEWDFTFDAAKCTLSTEFPIPRTGGRGVLTFAVTENAMNGTMMIYPEGKIGRRIHIERKKDPS